MELKKQRAKYWHVIDETKKIVKCDLCPNNCVIPESKTGVCGVRININAKLYSLNYGFITDPAIDPIEKKPLYHFYPSSHILSFGTVGCNLRCLFCQNYHMSRASAEDGQRFFRYYSPDEIIEIAELNNIKMIAYTYNEPTIFFEFMLDVAKKSKKLGLKNVIVTNGYINEEPLKELIQYIDAANVDLKAMDKEFYRKITSAKLDPVLNTITLLNEHKVHLELTNLVIPGLNDKEEQIRRLVDWVANLNPSIPLHFSRFFPYYKLSHLIPTPSATLKKAYNIGKERLEFVYLGNIRFDHEFIALNTYCPKCNSLLIDRQGYEVKTYLDIDAHGNAKCPKCGYRIYGRF